MYLFLVCGPAVMKVLSQISASIHNNRTDTHDAVELLVLLMLFISCVF